MTDRPHEGTEYHHEDGTVEVVVTVSDGRVLTLREYPDSDAFERAISDVERSGTNPLVAEISMDLLSDKGDRG